MTFEEFDKNTRENGDSIFVRAQVNGKWGSHSLNELTEESRLSEIQRFWNEKRMPVRVK